MGDLRIKHIPFRELERMGLWVIDSGDGGQDIDIGEPAVDAADQALRVVSASGHTVYDSRDDSFPVFYQAMRAVLAGQATRWSSKERLQSRYGEPVIEIGSAVEHLRHFADGQLTTSCRRFERVMAQDRMSDSTCFSYRHGQTLRRWSRTQRIEPAGKVPVESKGGFTDLRTMDALTWSIRRDGATLTVADVLQEKNYPLDSLADAEHLLEAIRAEHNRMGFRLTPTAWGYQATLHGVPVRIWIDPLLGETNRSTVIDIMAGLARMPPDLLRLMLRFRTQKYREPFLALQIVDSRSVSADLALLRRRMQSGVRFAKVVSVVSIPVGGEKLPLLQTTFQPSHDASDEDLTWYAHFLEVDDEHSNAEYVHDTGRIQVTKAMTSSAVIRHELGHLVEHLLGAEFSADVASLYGPYMEHVLAAEMAPAPVRAAWTRLQHSAWEKLAASDRSMLQPFFAQASEYGLLLRGYSGTDPKEWFADLFAAAWTGTNSDDQPIPNHAPYRPILQAIRVAMTKGHTPTQIRQLFRQYTMEM